MSAIMGNLNNMSIRAIITGASGMVGEGVLIECLESSKVEAVLVLGRKPCGITHPKLKEVLVKDFTDLTVVENELKGYNACFFCAGVSSVGKTEEEFRHLTYDVTMNVANTLVKVDPESAKNMTFTYVTGGGTDSTEKGSVMWARVKGKTENDLMKLPFKNVFPYRVGYMHPIAGMKHVLKMYYLFMWMYPLAVKLWPSYAISLKEVGDSMIASTELSGEKRPLFHSDIRALTAKGE